MSGISNMPQESTIPGGVGQREESLHPECGLRVVCISHMTAVDIIGLVSQLFGTSGGTSVPDWTPLTLLNNGRMDVPMTPSIFVTTAAPTDKFARFRFRGLDQFYAHQTEITPWLGSGPRANTLTPISKVFSLITSIEFQSIGYDTATSDSINIGISNVWDPVNAADDTENLIGAITLQFQRNMGIGIPIRITPYGTEDPYKHPEILGDVMGHNPSQTLDQSGLPAIASIKPLPSAGAGAGFTVGVSESGWQGATHKLGFDSSDNWATEKIPLVDGSGDFRMGGEVEGVASSPPRAADILEFTFMVRTASGTRRRANPKSSYEYAQN